MAEWVGLIRAIGPITHKKMSMADLRGAATAQGLLDVRTVLATGNLLFQSPKGRETLQILLQTILTGFGLVMPGNSVCLLTKDEVRQVMREMPFGDAVTLRPSKVLFIATASPLDRAAQARIAGWDIGPERLVAVSRGLFVDYVDGVGTSKLTPARLDRMIGQPGTGRNWNTMGKLAI